MEAQLDAFNAALAEVQQFSCDRLLSECSSLDPTELASELGLDRP